MNIILYYNSSDNRDLNKTLLNGFTLSGTLRESSSIIKPTIKMQASSILRYNYAYIPEFNRYYFITDVTTDRQNIQTVSFYVDPLMSFRGDINVLKAVIDKQYLPSNGDEYIDDGSLVTNNLMFNTVYNFPNGFNDNGEYILITAG